MPAILHGLAAWGRIMTREIEEIERIQSKALKQLLQVPISASTAGVLMEKGIWPAKEYLQYSIMMLYHSIMSSEWRRTDSKKYSQRATQIQSSANLSQQSSFNQQRDRSRYKSSRKTQEVSMEEIDQAKKGNIQKRL